MDEPINTHGKRISFGRHKGERYTRLPLQYLKWMVNNNIQEAELAKAELERRGTVATDLEVSGHALDRASLNCRSIWRNNSSKGEGIYTWLNRAAKEALEHNQVDKNGRYIYNGMKFAFELDLVWPVLKTVIRITKGDHHANSKDDSKK